MLAQLFGFVYTLVDTFTPVHQKGSTKQLGTIELPFDHPAYQLYAVFWPVDSASKAELHYLPTGVSKIK
jgi:hypothetical protein